MYKDILLPIDLTQPSSYGESLPAAIEFCEAFKARLHVLTVIPDYGMSIVSNFFPDDFEEKALEETNKKLHEFVEEHIPKKIPVQHIVAIGTVYKEIIHKAIDVNADLIIMNSHRPELKDYLLGPNTAKVVRHGKTSIMVVRDYK